jgi:hypothetical protein
VTNVPKDVIPSEVEGSVSTHKMLCSPQPILRLRSYLASLSMTSAADLLRGLFSQPTKDAPPGCDYAAALEERYRSPRRCC